jgi:hypothetical protein
MPFPDDGGLITGLLEVFRKRRLRAVELRVVVVDEAVDVRMQARDGPQIEFAQYERSKTAPCLARRSMLGVDAMSLKRPP